MDRGLAEQALLHYFDKTTGRKSRKPPQFTKKSQRIVALIEISAPICLECFSDYPQLGRLPLRDEGTCGVVLTVSPLADPTWQEKRWPLARFAVSRTVFPEKLIVLVIF
jgi:hypothetical protein